MSYHLIHILQHQSRLHIDRGCLVLETSDGVEKRAPLADILAVIVAARGVSFSGDALSAILSNGGIVLHCDHNYRPVGKTVGLHRVVHSEIFERQIGKSPDFSGKLWSRILKAKIENQAVLLDSIKAAHKLHEYLAEAECPDEGNAARHYWKFYFSKFGRKAPQEREHKDAEHPVNQMLNYSYAVMGAIIHRSAIAHGLNTTLGIHHKYRFRSEPLVYDLLEPLRPFCDLMLLRFKTRNPRKPIEEYIKSVAADIVGLRVRYDASKTLKLVNAIDRYISSVTDCFYSGVVQEPFIPRIADLS
ncbi:MAG: hypothetical protein CVU77_04830 [Elusimicrobia bacterium HGW-Elusimicrobia-1]|jgi:CRISPR-associated protein Cas1|nr:MAG: hypothetical protein CVU77_04830 [Elusimicrobia bacterium HGW-Elusimicrobia-1]